jgi:hypothetical protein
MIFSRITGGSIWFNPREMPAADKLLYLDSIKCLNNRIAPIVDEIPTVDRDPVRRILFASYSRASKANT